MEGGNGGTVIMRENIHGRSGGGPILWFRPLTSDSSYSPPRVNNKRGVLDPDCFPTIATFRTLVPGREHGAMGNGL